MLLLGAQACVTVNAAAAEPECTEMISPNAFEVADTPENGWYLISPLGSFPRPNPADGTQIFGIDQARAVVSTFNSLIGTAARYFKNRWHGLGGKASVPIFEGHSDYDSKRWKTMNQLGEITALHADDQGLWGQVTWNSANLASRTQERGPLKPSPIFWHHPPDERGHVFPELLESVGLVIAPNIRNAPQWTANADLTLARTPQAENQTKNVMNEEQMKELRKRLGLPETADVATILNRAQTANAAIATVTERDNALNTANSTRTDLESKLQTANGQVTTITAERDQLKTANGALTTERDGLRTSHDALVEGVLNLAEKKGAITPAERDGFKTRITTANTAADALKELPGRKAMNVQQIEINGNRLDLSTANSRAAAFNAEVEKRKQANGGDYDKAFADCLADPQLKPLVDAMETKS